MIKCSNNYMYQYFRYTKLGVIHVYSMIIQAIKQIIAFADICTIYAIYFSTSVILELPSKGTFLIENFTHINFDDADVRLEVKNCFICCHDCYVCIKEMFAYQFW